MAINNIILFSHLLKKKKLEFICSLLQNVKKINNKIFKLNKYKMFMYKIKKKPLFNNIKYYLYNNIIVQPTAPDQLLSWVWAIIYFELGLDVENL